MSLLPSKLDETVSRLLAIEDERTGGFVEPYPPIRPTKAYPNPYDCDTPRIKLVGILREAKVDADLIEFFQKLPVEAQLFLCNTTYKMTLQVSHQKPALTDLVDMAKAHDMGRPHHDKSPWWRDRYHALASGPCNTNDANGLSNFDAYCIGLIATIRDFSYAQLDDFESLSVDSEKWVVEWLTYLPHEKHIDQTAKQLCDFAYLYFEYDYMPTTPPTRQNHSSIPSGMVWVERPTRSDDDDDDDDAYYFVPPLMSDHDEDMDSEC